MYEIASFLHGHADDEAFWTEWRRLHSDTLRRLQTVGFLLAEAWFGCRLAPAVREEAERLPAATRVWFEEFATSPAVQRFRANKDELWLHLSLLDSKLDATAGGAPALDSLQPSAAGAGHQHRQQQRGIRGMVRGAVAPPHSFRSGPR